MARAQDGAVEHPRVAIAIDPSCAELDAELVAHVLQIELGADAELARSDVEATSRARVSCEGTSVAVDVDDGLTRKRLQRTFDLASAPPAVRARLVALAIAELLGAAWVELGMRHDAELDAVRPAPEGSEEARAAALDAARDRLVEETAPGDLEAPTTEPIGARPLGIHVLGALRVSGEPLHVAGGAGLGLDVELYAPLAIVLDARAEHGRVEAGALGSVGVTTAWLGALLALRLPFGLDHADFGVGARGGVAILEGRASSGASADTIVGGTLAVISAAHLSLHVVGSAYLHVGVELGWIAVPVRGTLAPTGETIAGIAGALGVLTLGVEIRPE
ncbi:hypothetical protein [Sandaracinus amylolyticus]|uniref:Uncharacterized protein n=1 Tax=Sandaracinus amylolyticus TaxID=927083 RepID=A0A0F6W8K3_9BACT|nr:hypothetical protein [Sandaracinus amylolyticus]AKF10155.1 hypothetical protein DB32_007304 [Sandaracinus amylolyticus]